MSHIDFSTLRIKEFDLKQMKKHSAIVMIAKRNSGKSWVTRDIIYNKVNDFPTGVIISGTEEVSPFYGKFFPDTFIYKEYDPDLIQKIFKRQKVLKRKAEQRLKTQNKKINTSTLLVMDDCLADGSWKKDRQIKEIFMNGRHYDLMYILTMQYPVGIGPELRANFDYIFILACDIIANRKKIYEQYAGMIPTYEMFDKLLNSCTQDHGCMVIDNSSSSKDITERIFWFKAKDRDNFMFGSEKFLNFHKKNYDPKYLNRPIDNAGFILNHLTVKKKTPSFDIRKVHND